MVENQGTTKQYKCQWCGHEFKRYVFYGGTTKKGTISTQIKCPNCLRYIPTWEKKLTGNLISNKHIHVDR